MFGAAGSRPELTLDDVRTGMTPGSLSLSAEEQAAFSRQVQASDKELEARVDFRWDKSHVDLLKRAATTVGVPLQTFMKVALYEKATQVLKDAKELS